MRIAVVGIGGVGGYFGGRLTTTEHDVIFIARGEHGATIREHGLQVTSELGDFVAKPALVTDDPSAVGIVDYVIVTVKSWQLRDAIPMIRPMVGEHTCLVPLLNGVEAPDQLGEAFGSEKALGGFCRVLSWIEAPGKITQRGIKPDVAFGEMDTSESERVTRLRQIFESGNVQVSDTPDIQAAMWQKMVFIASISGVGAVTRMPAGVIGSVPVTRQMTIDAIQEAADVALARGVKLSPQAVEKAMAMVDGFPYDATVSMQRDIMDGRPSELEGQNGAIVRLGKEVSVPTPIHSFLYASLLPGELKARGKL